MRRLNEPVPGLPRDLRLVGEAPGQARGGPSAASLFRCALSGALAGALGLLLALAPNEVSAGGGREDWRVALLACLDLVETGDAGVLKSSGWMRSGAWSTVTYRHPRGVEISVREPLERPLAVDWVCSLSYATKIPGNDRRGQILRDALSALAKGRLEFREEDQFLPSDVYRGCAWDGQEFRLSSMTQTTFAHFTLQLSPRDPPCAALTN